MKLKKILKNPKAKIILLLWLVLQSILSSGQVVFSSHYALSKWTMGVQVIEKPEGYYCISNDKTSYYDSVSMVNEYRHAGVISKHDFDGTLLDYRVIDLGDTIGWHSMEFFRTMFSTSDGNIVVIGTTNTINPNVNGDHDIWILKFNTNLDTLWTKSHSIPGRAVVLNKTIGYLGQNDTIVVAGSTMSYIGGPGHGYICALDSTGEKLFDKEFYNELVLVGATRTQDGGFLLTGRESHPLSTNSIPVIVKVDSIGNPLWLNALPYSIEFNEAYNIIRSNDGNHIFPWSRTTLSPGAINKMKEYNVTKIDQHGNEIWTKTHIQSFSTHQRISKSNGDNFIISGWYTDTVNGNVMEAYLAKCDANGDPLWIRHLARAIEPYIFDGISTSDGGYLLCGETYCCNYDSVRGTNGSSLYLLKLDSLGLIISVPENPGLLTKFVLENPYPNPTHGILNIKVNSNDKNNCSVYLFDMNGRELLSRNLSPGESEATMDVSGLPAGTYLIALNVDGYNAGVKQVVIQ